MSDWIIRSLAAVVFAVLLYVLGRRVTGLSKKQSAWGAIPLGGMFIGMSLYFGLRSAIMLCLAATAAGVVVPLSERWFASASKKEQRSRATTAIIVAVLFVIVGTIEWLVNGSRRVASVLVAIGFVIVVASIDHLIALRRRDDDA